MTNKYPPITTIQIVAITQALIAVVVAFGFDLPPGASEAIVQLATILAGSLPLADAGLRASRNAREARTPQQVINHGDDI